MNLAKGFVVAGTNSGCGKTTLTLALMAYFSQQGRKVAPFKVGPDFIDPGHHRRVTGVDSQNLDGWMLSREYNHASFAGVGEADLAVVEGVMGLFDGYDGKTEAGSTAQMAKWLGLPVILVVNAQSMARSAAALVSGFERFDPELKFAGVIFNKLGSKRHLQYLMEAMAGHVAMPCLGGIYRDQSIAIPERHLGLFTDDDHALSGDSVQQLVGLIADNIDIDLLLARLEATETELSAARPAISLGSIDNLEGGKKVRIGIARDKAFCFYYPDNLRLLEQSGADLVYFSPLEERELPENLDGLYLGGGYPELHCQRLAENTILQVQIRDKSCQGMPIFAECGGFMYLCSEIVDLDGKAWPMAGCFPFSVRMLDRLRSLGYREITLKKDSILGPVGQVIRGHEFHYSEIHGTPEQAETVFQVTPRAGKATTQEGYCRKNTLGGYLHLHFGSHPDVAENLIRACKKYKNKRAGRE